MSALSEAETRLTAVKAAYDKAVTGLTVWYGDMRITRQNIDILRNEMTYWQRQVDALNAQAAGVTNPGVLTPRWS